MKKENNFLKIEIDKTKLKDVGKRKLKSLKEIIINQLIKTKERFIYIKRFNEIKDEGIFNFYLYGSVGVIFLISIILMYQLRIITSIMLFIFLITSINLFYRRIIPKQVFKKLQQIYKEQSEVDFADLSVQNIFIDMVFTIMRIQKLRIGYKYYALHIEEVDKCYKYLSNTTIKNNQQLERLKTYCQNNSFSPKTAKVLRNILEFKEEFGFMYHEDNQIFITETQNSTEIKCRLFEGKTIKNIRKNIPLIQQKTSFKQIKVTEDGVDARYFSLKVIFNNKIKVEAISVQDRISFAEKEIIKLGNTENGSAEISSKSLNKNVSHWLLSALSGSGKSVLTLNVLVSLLNLKYKENYMYEDCLIVSLKSQDYLEAHLDERGIVIRDTVEDMERMIDYVTLINQQRINILKKNRVANANELNQQINDKKILNEERMPSLLLVLDEFQNLLEEAEPETKKYILGKVAVLLRTSRSQNINIIIVQQSAKKEDLKNIRQNVNILILGRQIDDYELMSLDKTCEITKYYKHLDSNGIRAQGKFFINSEIKIKNMGLNYSSGFSILHTPNTNKQEIAKYFTRNFTTNEKYSEKAEQVYKEKEIDIDIF